MKFWKVEYRTQAKKEKTRRCKTIIRIAPLRISVKYRSVKYYWIIITAGFEFSETIVRYLYLQNQRINRH